MINIYICMHMPTLSLKFYNNSNIKFLLNLDKHCPLTTTFYQYYYCLCNIMQTAVQVVNMQINGLSELLQKGVNEANQTGVNRTVLRNINETTQNGMVYK